MAMSRTTQIVAAVVFRARVDDAGVNGIAAVMIGAGHVEPQDLVIESRAGDLGVH